LQPFFYEFCLAPFYDIYAPLKMKKTALILYFFIVFFAANGQNKFPDQWVLGANYQYGVVLPEYSNILQLVNDEVKSGAITISKQTIGTTTWQQLYNYPELGISFFYTTLGNADVYGSEFAIFPYATLHLLQKKKFSIDNTLGVGLGYATKKFDLEKNYLNVAVGSHFNIHFNFKLGLQYSITKKIMLRSGFSFDHLSNGNLAEPNLGLNNLTVYGGLAYFLSAQAEKIKTELEPHKKTTSYEALYSFGGKHTRALTSKFYFTSSASFSAIYKLFRAFHLSIGADVFYDSATEVELKSKNQAYKKSYDFSSGIHLGQHLVYNRLSVILQEGFYFIPNKAVNKPMYNRGIVKYQLTKNFSVRIAMKSHLHILDYPEIGVGFNW
jgi:hypothetical protein